MAVSTPVANIRQLLLPCQRTKQPTLIRIPVYLDALQRTPRHKTGNRHATTAMTRCTILPPITTRTFDSATRRPARPYPFTCSSQGPSIVYRTAAHATPKNAGRTNSDTHDMVRSIWIIGINLCPSWCTTEVYQEESCRTSANTSTCRNKGSNINTISLRIVLAH